MDNTRRFVQVREPLVVKIREHVLRLAHLNRCQSPVVNRLRQDLAWQFPEIAKVGFKRNGSRVSRCLLWLAGEVESSKYDSLKDKSVGLGIQPNVNYHAQRLCHLHREEFEIEGQLLELTCHQQFDVYRRVFNRFGFGQRIEAMILSQIYPLENYLTPEVKLSHLVTKATRLQNASCDFHRNALLSN